MNKEKKTRKTAPEKPMQSHGDAGQQGMSIKERKPANNAENFFYCLYLLEQIRNGCEI